MSEGLRVDNLSHFYGSKMALDAVSFDVRAGAFCALLGPNGAGKSTLFSLLTRLYAPRQGVIKIAGCDINKTPSLALEKLGVVFQQPTLDLDLSVYQNMIYFAALHGFAGKNARSRIDRALERLDMRERAHEKTRLLNGGHRRRMEIARALVHSPKVLLLDEPTVGLDAPSRRGITQHVHDLAKQDGLTVLWATHLVDEVDEMDQLIVLHRGQIVANGLCKEVCGEMGLADAFSHLTCEDAL